MWRRSSSSSTRRFCLAWRYSALIEIYEADEKHPVKIDLLDQVVGIMRRKDGREERVRDIANLMRDWQENRRENRRD